jgi:hypothetical protein
VSTKIEFYQRLREHIPEEAARMIAEEMSTESQLVTHEEFNDGIHRLELLIEKLRSSSFRWNLLFFVPLWVGVYATLVAILLRGTP